MKYSLLKLFFFLSIIGGFAQVQKVNFETLSKTEFNKKNDTTYVINFWATWCRPCIEELPEFKKAIDTNKENPVKFIFVSLDNPNHEARVNAFIQKKSIGGTNYLLTNVDANKWIDKVSTEWDGVIPATFIYNNESFSFFHQGQLSFLELNTKIIESLNQ